MTTTDASPRRGSTEPLTVPFRGVLDVKDSYGHVRTAGYLPGADDVYVSAAQLRAHRLRPGDAVVGTAKPRTGRDKTSNLVHLESVNESAPGTARPVFADLTPLFPQQRLRLDGGNPAVRALDLISPIGKGQRGLIVSPPKAGKTMLLRAVAQAISDTEPDCHLMVLLIDERPEEVTDIARSIRGEVLSSTFDRPPAEHIALAELALERAKRLVELGHDVVLLLDSITRLGRAYNLAASPGARILSGGVAAGALYPPKRFLGAARNVENGGSLTILATALVETGSRMDEVFFEEFKGTGNMEIKLDRGLAEKRLFPAVHIEASGTRREELLMSAEELQLAWRLRRALGSLSAQQGLEKLLERVRATKSNAEVLLSIRDAG